MISFEGLTSLLRLLERMINNAIRGSGRLARRYGAVTWPSPICGARKASVKFQPASIREPDSQHKNKRCDACGGSLGLIVHRWWGYRFCRKACKNRHLAKIENQREKLREWLWLGTIARGSSK
jgi:hypothetical protein